MEYEVGDICEVTGTWYGGVHINGRSGIPVSLDKEEYMELNTEPEEPDSAENENTPEPPIPGSRARWSRSKTKPRTRSPRSPTWWTSTNADAAKTPSSTNPAVTV